MGRLPDILEAAWGRRAVRRAFGRANLPLAVARAPELRLPLASLIVLFDSAALECGDRCLGLRVAQRMSYRDFGRWTDYSAAAPTLGDALGRVERSFGLFQSGAAFRLLADSDGICWSYARPYRRDRGREHADHILPPMIEFLRVYLGDDWMPDHVRVCYPRGTDGHLVEQALGTSVRFDASSIGIPLKRTELLAPLRRTVALSERVTFEDLLASEADRHDGSVSSAVRHILAFRLPEGRTDIEGTAQVAGIGPRSLQRRLRAEGTTYRRIVEETRVQRAVGLLRDSEETIADIAAALGYSEPGNFARAFRRVTGRTPNEVRCKGGAAVGRSAD
jgi:AraC-like DNA-binding protein